MSAPDASHPPPSPLRWLDDLKPLEPDDARAQLDGLRALLGSEPRRILDLGCGAGRTLLPLAEAGHEVVGLDVDVQALAHCRHRLREVGGTAQLLEADFQEPWPDLRGPFDAVLCLGNTIMTIVDVDVAVRVMGQARRALRSGGVLVTDDCPGSFWPELAEGAWQTGISEDGDAQLVWEASDAVFALRQGDAVDPDRPWIDPGERRFRLWTDGALRLAARAAGLSAPERHAEWCLLLMRHPAT